MKEFDSESAEAGAKICTRDGRDARIISFGADNAEHANIVALVREVNGEHPYLYYKDGKCVDGCEVDDLFMRVEKREGWINVYGCEEGMSNFYGGYIFPTKSEAEKCIDKDEDLEHLATVKICWEG